MGDEGDTARELDALRRRAYGPGAGIADDPVALARLELLEELAREDRTRPPELIAADEAEDPVSAAPPPGPPTARVVGTASSTNAARRRPRWHSASIAAVAVTALALAVPQLWGRDEPSVATPALALQPVSSYALTDEEEARVLLRIPLDGSFGSYVDLPVAEVPPFKEGIALQWAKPIGRYYGWHPWIGRAATGEACLLVERADERVSQCLSTAAQAQGQLSVEVPFDEVPSLERPLQMGAGQSIVFRWLFDDRVTIMLETTAID